jgi:hypothetical protein
MTKPKQILKPSKNSQEMAMFLAMVVRNAMEDFHHRHLSDEQMKELNPIIRNAIYTGLQALRHYDRSEAARSFADFQNMLIPKYWEQPELLTDFVESVKMMNGGNENKEPSRTTGSRRLGDPRA